MSGIPEMTFNSEPRAVEVSFLKKVDFNHTVLRVDDHKHIGLILRQNYLSFYW